MATKRKIGLSPRKKQWTQGREGNLNGTPLANNVALGNRYARRLDSLTVKMIKDVEKQIRKLLRGDASRAYFALDASIASESSALMKTLTTKWLDIFNQASKPYATSMVKSASKQSEESLGMSLEQLSGGLSIKTNTISGEVGEVLKASINTSVDLIESIPTTYLDQVKNIVNASVTQPSQGGLIAIIKDIDEKLDKQAKQIKNKAKNIALDQSKKTYANLNAARMQGAGITEYRWIHVGGSKEPNQFHLHELNNQVFSFANPPIIDKKTGTRGIPGQWYNCNCIMQPVFRFDNR